MDFLLLDFRLLFDCCDALMTISSSSRVLDVRVFDLLEFWVDIFPLLLLVSPSATKVAVGMSGPSWTSASGTYVALNIVLVLLFYGYSFV